MQAAYRVTAIDGFADSQTLAMASATELAPFDQDGFQEEAMLAIVAKLDASQYLGFIYGSGFEARPALLAKIAERIPMLGNLPGTVALIKAPAHFFSVCARLDIAHPKTWAYANAILPSQAIVNQALAKPTLLKSVGGSGGGHIKRYQHNETLISEKTYVQQALHGLPVSILFLANGQDVALVGFNELLLAPSKAMPYRYGGAVSQLSLPMAVQHQLLVAAQKLTAEFALLGLNSLDAVLQDDGVAYVLEVNPRLSASVALYDTAGGELNLLAMHLATCQHGQLKPLVPSVSVMPASRAQAVVYSWLELTIPIDFAWPEWVQDYPSTEYAHLIAREQPVCTVEAKAECADVAKQLLTIRVKMLNQLLANYLKEDEDARTD
ncbi:MAG: ATP-grasp domain-containing protein [Methylotenera sp.]|nr:ATP-grasp domain-containing protein [Methylotenera sp.]